ncbi:MAG: hypothetical protein ACRD3O_02555 [Terriglobia bacterium]
MELKIGTDADLSSESRLPLMASKACLWASCLVVSMLLMATRALPQTLQAWKFPNNAQTTLYPLTLTNPPSCTGPSGSCTAYINPADPTNEQMPKLEFGVSGYPSTCAKIQWTGYASYLDPEGYAPYATTTATTSPCSEAFIPSADSWSSPGGGTVTVLGYLETSCGSPVTNSAGEDLTVGMEFYIWGDNQSKAQTDAAESSVGLPWFAGSIITYESCSAYSATNPTAVAPQFSPSNGFCGWSENKVVGQPLYGGPPPDDGIGLMQPDRSVSADYITSGTYFNYADNMETAWDILWLEKANESEDNWLTEYETDSHYTAVTGDQSYTHCYFYSNTEPLGDHSYGDADWIQDYNTHSGGYYYLWWVAGAGWQFKWKNPSQAGYNYAEEVCEHAPY